MFIFTASPFSSIARSMDAEDERQAADLPGVSRARKRLVAMESPISAVAMRWASTRNALVVAGSPGEMLAPFQPLGEQREVGVARELPGSGLGAC